MNKEILLLTSSFSLTDITRRNEEIGLELLKVRTENGPADAPKAPDLVTRDPKKNKHKDSSSSSRSEKALNVYARLRKSYESGIKTSQEAITTFKKALKGSGNKKPSAQEKKKIKAEEKAAAKNLKEEKAKQKNFAGKKPKGKESEAALKKLELEQIENDDEEIKWCKQALKEYKVMQEEGQLSQHSSLIASVERMLKERQEELKQTRAEMSG